MNSSLFISDNLIKESLPYLKPNILFRMNAKYHTSCAVCHKEITLGSTIAFNRFDETWVHLECIQPILMDFWKNLTDDERQDLQDWIPYEDGGWDGYFSEYGEGGCRNIASTPYKDLDDEVKCHMEEWRHSDINHFIALVIEYWITDDFDGAGAGIERACVERAHGYPSRCEEEDEP